MLTVGPSYRSAPLSATKIGLRDVVLDEAIQEGRSARGRDTVDVAVFFRREVLVDEVVEELCSTRLGRTCRPGAKL